MSGSPVWIDAQLPPALAGWLRDLGETQAAHVEGLGLLRAEDPEIFEAARRAGAVVITKDSDFVDMQERLGKPPQIVWLTCGNRSNQALRVLISTNWTWVRELLAAGEPLIEISQTREVG